MLPGNCTSSIPKNKKDIELQQLKYASSQIHHNSYLGWNIGSKLPQTH